MKSALITNYTVAKSKTLWTLTLLDIIAAFATTDYFHFFYILFFSLKDSPGFQNNIHILIFLFSEGSFLDLSSFSSSAHTLSFSCSSLYSLSAQQASSIDSIWEPVRKAVSEPTQVLHFYKMPGDSGLRSNGLQISGLYPSLFPFTSISQLLGTVPQTCQVFTCSLDFSRHQIHTAFHFPETTTYMPYNTTLGVLKLIPSFSSNKCALCSH